MSSFKCESEKFLSKPPSKVLSILNYVFFVIAIALIFFVTMFLFSNDLLAKEFKKFEVYVESCYDGDTCNVVFNLDPPFNKQKVRFLGIDTPEIRGKCEAEKKLARKARDYVRSKVQGKNVIALVPIDGKYQGKYGRTLVRLLVDGKDLSNELLKLGLAREYKGRRTNFCGVKDGV